MNDEFYQRYREKCINGPRLTTLRQYFNQLSAGESQVPRQPVKASEEFLSQSIEISKYHDLLCNNAGPMQQHFFASVPFSLEEYCRTGIACVRLAQALAKDKTGYFTYYGMNSGDGTRARTIAEYSNGLIRTFTDNPSLENMQSFYRSYNPDYSTFYHGLFCDVTPAFLASRPEFSLFKDGFDFIISPIVFPFYGPNRLEQIKYLSRLLKQDGLLICMEKLKCPQNMSEYQRFEKIKDEEFKSRYFSDEEIAFKDRSILKEVLNTGQVSFSTISTALKHHFENVYLIWNSANFYDFVASRNRRIIETFIALMPKPYVPVKFCAESNMIRRL